MRALSCMASLQHTKLMKGDASRFSVETELAAATSPHVLAQSEVTNAKAFGTSPPAL